MNASSAIAVDDRPVTTDSRAAAATTRRAIDALLARSANTMPLIGEALEQDPDCAMAQLLNGLMLCGARKSAPLGAAREALACVEAQRDRLDARESRYADALAAAIDRDPDRTVRAYESIVETHPTDLLALTMAQGELFWTGDMPRSLVLSSQAEPHWHDGVPGWSDWLALRAFDLEEAGELEAAERAGREAVARDASSLWGAHAVAHVLEMRGDAAAGIDWLAGLQAGWAAGGPMKFHLWWHRALCHVELGEHDAALALHDLWLRSDDQPLQRALPDFYLDVQNGASHLLRLELVGVDVGMRWERLAEAIEGSWQDLSNPFTTLHVAMVLVATGRHDRLHRLIDDVTALAERGDGSLADAYRDAPAVLRAIGAHRRGDHARVVAEAAPIRGALWRLGGSHAQRDVLFQLLFDSARRVGDDALMRAIHRDLERIGFIAPERRAAYGANERPVARSTSRPIPEA